MMSVYRIKTHVSQNEPCQDHWSTKYQEKHVTGDARTDLKAKSSIDAKPCSFHNLVL